MFPSHHGSLSYPFSYLFLTYFLPPSLFLFLYFSVTSLFSHSLRLSFHLPPFSSSSVVSRDFPNFMFCVLAVLVETHVVPYSGYLRVKKKKRKVWGTNIAPQEAGLRERLRGEDVVTASRDEVGTNWHYKYCVCVSLVQFTLSRVSNVILKPWGTEMATWYDACYLLQPKLVELSPKLQVSYTYLNYLNMPNWSKQMNAIKQFVWIKIPAYINIHILMRFAVAKLTWQFVASRKVNDRFFFTHS